MAEECELGSAVHLPHDSLRLRVNAFSAAVVVRERKAGVDGGPVEFEAVGEGVQVGQVGGPDCGDPLGEPGVVARSRGEEVGELSDEVGQFGQLRAGRR